MSAPLSVRVSFPIEGSPVVPQDERPGMEWATAIRVKWVEWHATRYADGEVLVALTAYDEASDNRTWMNHERIPDWAPVAPEWFRAVERDMRAEGGAA